jgi:hypothetical protein
METFESSVHRAAIAMCKELLSDSEITHIQRAVIRKLLAEEEAKYPPPQDKRPQ